MEPPRGSRPPLFDSTHNLTAFGSQPFTYDLTLGDSPSISPQTTLFSSTETRVPISEQRGYPFPHQRNLYYSFSPQDFLPISNPEQPVHSYQVTSASGQYQQNRPSQPGIAPSFSSQYAPPPLPRNLNYSFPAQDFHPQEQPVHSHQVSSASGQYQQNRPSQPGIAPSFSSHYAPSTPSFNPVTPPSPTPLAESSFILRRLHTYQTEQQCLFLLCKKVEKLLSNYPSQFNIPPNQNPENLPYQCARIYQILEMLITEASGSQEKTRIIYQIYSICSKSTDSANKAEQVASRLSEFTLQLDAKHKKLQQEHISLDAKYKELQQEHMLMERRVKELEKRGQSLLDILCPATSITDK